MVERFKGPTAPNGKQIPTLYSLSDAEVTTLTKRWSARLKRGGSLEGLASNLITAKPGSETDVEEMFRSFGLEIYSVGQG